MDILDTRDLIKTRDELKQQILDSFKDTFEHYADDTDSFEDILFDEEEIQNWKEDWQDELEQIQEIDNVESEVGSEFEYGCAMINEDYFEEYAEKFVEDCGYISKDMSYLIRNNIDFKGIADDLRVDYSEVKYQGRTYLVRG